MSQSSPSPSSSSISTLQSPLFSTPSVHRRAPSRSATPASRQRRPRMDLSSSSESAMEESKVEEDDQEMRSPSPSPTRSPRPNVPINPFLDQISASKWTKEIVVTFQIPSNGSDGVVKVGLADFFPTLRDANGNTTTRIIVAPPAPVGVPVVPVAPQQGVAGQQSPVAPAQQVAAVPFGAILLQELNRLQPFVGSWKPDLSPNPPAPGHEVAATFAKIIANQMVRLNMNTSQSLKTGSLLTQESTVDAVVTYLLNAFGFNEYPLILIPQAPFPLFMNTMIVEKAKDLFGEMQTKLIRTENSVDAKADFAIYGQRSCQHMLVVEDKSAMSSASADAKDKVYAQAIAEAVAAAQVNMRTKVLAITREDPFNEFMLPAKYESKREESVYFATVCGTVMQFYCATFTRQTLVEIAEKGYAPVNRSKVNKLELPDGFQREISSFDFELPTDRPALFTALLNLKAFMDQNQQESLI